MKKIVILVLLAAVQSSSLTAMHTLKNFRYYFWGIGTLAGTGVGAYFALPSKYLEEDKKILMVLQSAFIGGTLGELAFLSTRRGKICEALRVIKTAQASKNYNRYKTYKRGAFRPTKKDIEQLQNIRNNLLRGVAQLHNIKKPLEVITPKIQQEINEYVMRVNEDMTILLEAEKQFLKDI